MEEVIVSAPGKIILHGEHSVVYGRSAIACSLNIRTFLTLKQTTDNNVSLVLPDVGITKSWSLDDLKKMNFIPGCEADNPKPPTEEQLKQIKDFLQHDDRETKDIAVVSFMYIYLSVVCKEKLLPIEVKVKSELPIGAGLGSSAGYSVCVSSALLLMMGTVSTPTEQNIWKKQDLDLVNKWAFVSETFIHGKPSGIDNSIASYGKAIKFKAGNINRLDRIPSLRVLLINTKVPRSTKDLVSGVRKKYEQYEEIVRPVLDSMEAIVNKSEDILTQMTNNDENLSSSYRLLQEFIDMNQDLLRFLGVSHPSLESVCSLCQQYSLHCKLTGAGGGGCAFCLIPPGTSEDVIKAVQVEVESKNFECWVTCVGGNGVMVHNVNNSDRTAIPEYLR